MTVLGKTGASNQNVSKKLKFLHCLDMHFVYLELIFLRQAEISLISLKMALFSLLILFGS